MQKTKRILWIAAALAAVLAVAVAGCKQDDEDDWAPVTIRNAVLEKYAGERTTVTVPDGVTGIGSKAFSGTAVTAVVIPADVKVIEADAFADSKVTSISYLGTLDKWNELVRDGLAGNIKVSCFIIKNGILTDYEGDETDVVIPAGYVKGIAPDVFSGRGITSVTIPGSVKRVGANAFADCTALADVRIEAGVAKVGARAFAGCTALETMVIPAGVTELGGGIFTGCTNLTELRIHESVTTIASGALTGTEGLKDIYYTGRKAQWEKLVAGKEQDFVGKRVYCEASEDWWGGSEQGTGVENPPKPGDPDTPDKPTCTEHAWGEYKSDGPDGHYRVCTGCGEKSKTEEHVYDNDSDSECNNCGYKRILKGPLPIEDGTLTIGDKGEVTGYKADVPDKKVNVVIPDGVTGIDGNAFQGHWELETVVIPGSVESIGANAFAGSGIQSVTLDGVKSIGQNAFEKCYNLTEVTIADGVKNIGSGAFAGCGALTSVVIPESVERIGNGAFQNCRTLETVVIENGATDIPADMFEGCSALKHVSIPNSVMTIGSGAFENCTALNDVNIPIGVTSIGDRAFKSCWGLSKIEIPASVKTIGQGAFFSSGVNTIIFAGTRAQWKALTSANDIGIVDSMDITCSDDTMTP
ncbi:MAG: leucine-rich repeat domain-containing protein [Treponemataceae bacterium]|nr:leucine-rich repeat domain-containing protein [Treponemataceae bacterium]